MMQRKSYRVDQMRVNVMKEFVGAPLQITHVMLS